MAGRALLPVLFAGALACGPAAGGTEGVPPWPDALPASDAFGAPRGFAARRAILHVHSIGSHDACDGDPVDAEGHPNEACLARFKTALCAARVDAAFLTEHDRHLVRADSMADALHLRPGDERVEREGRMIASRLACPGGGSGPLLFPGAENRLMPVALDSLPRGSHEERRDVYELQDASAVPTFHEYGAVVLLPHTEDVPLGEIADLDPDAIEIYNPHANFAPKHRRSQGLPRLGAFLDLLPFYLRLTDAHPDLALLPMFVANRTAIDRWDALLARRMTWGFGGSDAHENALPWPLSDGLRGDAYRRMIPWVTNVLMVAPAPAGEGGAGEATALEAALREGRFYVALEAWGTPAGFDFRLDGPGGSVEMGGTARLTPGQRLVVEPPVPHLQEGLPAPSIRTRLYRIDARGARTIVADQAGRVDVPVRLPGTYRVEVGLVPRHLAPYLGRDADRWLREVPWIYSNPIRVMPTFPR